jgi:hypothetical protein
MTEQTDYDRGVALGTWLREHRDAGGEYDVRWDFAREAKAGTFDEFKRGFDEGFGK